MAALSFLSSVAARPVAPVSQRRAAVNTRTFALGGGGPPFAPGAYE
jgi:hypothetical protein